jgi:LysM repeat protein
MKMKKYLKIVIAFSLILTLGACSSHKTTESEEGVDPALAASPDAGTDAVPQQTAENVADPSLDPYAALPPEPDAGLVQTPPPAEPVPAEVPAPPADQQAAVEPPPSPTGSGQFEDVTVQSGDTLMKIAFETYGDLYRWKSILDANRDRVTDPNQIPAGTVLKIERPATQVAIERNGEKYLIKNGDTLGTISNDVYGTRSKWKAIWENNKQMIHDPNRIFAGFYLYYQPDASSPPAENPTTQQQPLANAGGAEPGPAPTLAVPAPGDSTATTAGDTARAPASNEPAAPATQ